MVTIHCLCLDSSSHSELGLNTQVSAHLSSAENPPWLLPRPHGKPKSWLLLASSFIVTLPPPHSVLPSLSGWLTLLRPPWSMTLPQAFTLAVPGSPFHTWCPPHLLLVCTHPKSHPEWHLLPTSSFPRISSVYTTQQFKISSLHVFASLYAFPPRLYVFHPRVWMCMHNRHVETRGPPQAPGAIQLFLRQAFH